MKSNIYITKSNGDKEFFNADKLFRSLLNAGVAEPTAGSIVAHIQAEVTDGMTTHDIYKHAFSLLHKEHRPTALRYSLRRSLMELGPSGFPFEKFIAEMLHTQGYTVETDQVVQGRCVQHEIDVVAYTADKLIMIEAKFHNQLGVKSDLKVALYVKARFDDLMEATFHYGGKSRKLNEGWLVTNTKFTDRAVKYAACQNLKLIGWNYPEKGNLVDLIQSSNLLPLTVLTTLSDADKQELMKRGVVLCQALVKSPDSMREIGLKSDVITSVLEETKLVCPV